MALLDVTRTYGSRGNRIDALKGATFACRPGTWTAIMGAAGDNAAMESFFSLLQKNVLDRRGWNTREELQSHSSC